MQKTLHACGSSTGNGGEIHNAVTGICRPVSLQISLNLVGVKKHADAGGKIIIHRHQAVVQTAVMELQGPQDRACVASMVTLLAVPSGGMHAVSDLQVAAHDVVSGLDAIRCSFRSNWFSSSRTVAWVQPRIGPTSSSISSAVKTARVTPPSLSMVT